MLTDDGIRIEDLGSSNGTYVNGQRIQDSELSAGDQVGVGPVQFIVQINGVPDDDQITQPAPQFDPEDSSVRMPAPPAYPAAMSAGPSSTNASADLSDREAFPIEEIPLEEVASEPALAAEPATDDIPLREPHADLADEFALEEYPVEELADARPRRVSPSRRPAVPPVPRPPMSGETEVTIDDDLAPVETNDLHLDDAPAAQGDSEMEHVDLDSSEVGRERAVASGTEAGEAAPPPETTVEGGFDFVVEEPEAVHGQDDFHIDLDSPRHGQPHA